MIEEGVEKINGKTEVFAWVVIKLNEVCGKARTGTFFLPKKVVKLIKTGKEIGNTNDLFFKRTNSKQKNGAVGILTEDIITRTNLYAEAIILALIPFKNIDIYKSK